jgi:hypothetical protein
VEQRAGDGRAELDRVVALATAPSQDQTNPAVGVNHTNHVMPGHKDGREALRGLIER